MRRCSGSINPYPIFHRPKQTSSVGAFHVRSSRAFGPVTHQAAKYSRRDLKVASPTWLCQPFPSGCPPIDVMSFPVEVKPPQKKWQDIAMITSNVYAYIIYAHIYNEGPQPRSQKCLFLRPQKQSPRRARLPELGLCSQDSMR